MIADLLVGKTAREKANLKGQEIAKLFKVPKTQVGDYWIEITELKAIENGVELYARAWDANGQIGFGKDGSVDLERFVFINPPILVNDPNGSIIRESLDDNGKVRQRKLREDPKQALLESLAHTISVKTQKFNGTNIIPGKIGNTTTTVYPDAGIGGTTVDGYVARDVVTDASFAILRAGAGTSADKTSGQTRPWLVERDASGNWMNLYRSIHTFDTSSIPDTDTINSATFSISSYADNVDPANVDPDCNVYGSTPAANNDLAAADYAQTGSIAYSDSPILIDDWVTSGAYNNFAFNATGKAAIVKTGITALSWKNANYDNANVAPALGNGQRFTIGAYFADFAGTANDPKLVVEHTAAPIEKILTEVLTLTDTILKSTTRTLSEVLTLTDTIIRSITKTLSEVLTLIDTVLVERIVNLVLTETLVLTDSLVRLIERTLTEVVTLTDTIAKEIQRLFSETLTLTDTILRSITKVLTETITITDTISRSIQRLLSETITLVDTLVKSITKVLSEVITLTDKLFAKFPGLGHILGRNTDTSINVGTRAKAEEGLNKETGINTGEALK